MWRGYPKVWLHYRRDIIATDEQSAGYLVSFLHMSMINRSHLHQIEIIDLQRYKLIKKPVKVRMALKERLDTPFVFVVCKN